MTKEKVVTLPDDPALCLLVKGKEIVKDRWIKHDYELEGNVCALGAIGVAHNGDGHLLAQNNVDTLGPTHPAIVAANELASSVRVRDGAEYHDDYKFEKIPEWNDARSRKRHQVVKAFERAIQRRIKKLKAKQ